MIEVSVDEIVEVNGVKYIPLYASEIEGLSHHKIEELVWSLINDKIELTEGISERVWSSEPT